MPPRRMSLSAAVTAKELPCSTWPVTTPWWTPPSLQAGCLQAQKGLLLPPLWLCSTGGRQDCLSAPELSQRGSSSPAGHRLWPGFIHVSNACSQPSMVGEDLPGLQVHRYECRALPTVLSWDQGMGFVQGQLDSTPVLLLACCMPLA